MTISEIYAYSKQLSFQNPFSPNMEGIVDVHNNIMIVMLSFFFLFFEIFLYFIYAQNISKNNSNIYNHGHWSYGSVPPRPPKKNWKEKLKEHFSKYKEVYIGVGITLGLAIIYYYSGTYGGGNGSESGSSEIPITMNNTSNNSHNINNTATTNNDYNLSNISTTENSENSLVYTLSNNNYFSLIYKYFLIFGILNKFMAFHPLVETPSLNYLPFIISSNIVDFSLLTLNKYYGSCAVIGQGNHIGFMASYLTFLNQSAYFQYIVKQFQVDIKLHIDQLIMDRSFTYTSFINYYNIIIDILHKNELHLDVFKIFYYSQLSYLPPHLNQLFDQITERINEDQVNYLSSIEGHSEQFTMTKISDIISYILKEELEELQFSNEAELVIDQNHLLVLIFKILEVSHNNLNCFFDFELNIIENQSYFQTFYSLYLILLDRYNMDPCNIIEFLSFLIYHNCIEN